ncbi:MAG: hypothetical protein RBU29_15380, partial [bacterium]|nr:hypothetical protein [bacterium]
MIGRLSFLLTKTLCFSVCVWFFVLGLGFPAWGELVEAVVVHSEDYKTFGVLFTNGQVNRQLLSAKEMQYTADDWVPEGSLFHIKRYSFEQQQEMPWIQQLLETLKAYAPQTQLLLADQLRLGILAEGGTQNRLCIRASDYYTLPVESLPEVNLGPVMIKQAYLPDETPVPLGIMDCNGDQAMEVSIPWTEANAAQQARIVFNQLSCGSGFPLFVELTLRTGTDLVLESVDSAGTMVETQSFASSSTSQTVSFNHSNGISEI